MKKCLTLLLAVLLLTATSIAYADATCQLYLQVDFDENIIMARYDVEMYINGKKVAVIEHGGHLEQVFKVPQGLCEIRFRKVGSTLVQGAIYVGVDKSAAASFEIHANVADIEFRKLTCNSDADAYAFDVGEEVNFNGYGVSVAGYRMVSSYNNCMPGEGKAFLVCQLDIANRTEKDMTIPALLSTLNLEACCDNYELDCRWDVMYGLGVDAYFDEEGLLQVIQSMTQGSEVIRPGKQLAIELVYEVHPDWKVLEVFYGNKQLANDTHEIVFVVPRMPGR